MYSPQLVVELARLVVMEVDAARVYSNALALVPPGPIRDELVVIGREHASRVRALKDEITFRGYLAADPTSRLEGIALGAPVRPAGPPSPEEALAAVRRNEQLAASMYARVLARDPPDGARELLERLRRESERHVGWAERALLHRIWESPGAQA